MLGRNDKTTFGVDVDIDSPRYRAGKVRDMLLQSGILLQYSAYDYGCAEYYNPQIIEVGEFWENVDEVASEIGDLTPTSIIVPELNGWVESKSPADFSAVRVLQCREEQCGYSSAEHKPAILTRIPSMQKRTHLPVDAALPATHTPAQNPNPKCRSFTPHTTHLELPFFPSATHPRHLRSHTTQWVEEERSRERRPPMPRPPPADPPGTPSTSGRRPVVVGIVAMAWTASAKLERRDKMPEPGRFFPSRYYNRQIIEHEKKLKEQKEQGL
ncbi:hypothetical protein OPT61_g5218 [Boeremia exigua]|uniref:Uncharacterized protein n=1 Tax=Boeremia exigua TaxID=749465 RepID=A0ACC2IBB0_9PLEO|nr:hypothetical protein OPT61_g5218 [Boeremia exigua]